MFGIIGGSNFLKSQYFAALEVVLVDTPYGGVKLRKNDRVVFCQRHDADPFKEYTPAHLVNKKAIVYALKQVGVSRVLGFGSVGTLKPDTIPSGSCVVPDDWFCPMTATSLFDDFRGHTIPHFDTEFRNEVIEVLKRNGANPIEKAVYAQTFGPRFETKAEVRWLAQVADLIGMTAAHEAQYCNELNIPYALVCMVDNPCHGLDPVKPDLSLHDFHEGVRINLPKVERIIGVIIQEYCENSSGPAAATHDSVVELKEDANRVTQTRSVFWENDTLKMVDQRELPARYVLASFSDEKQVYTAIKDMLVRGAPAIGAAAGFGMVLAARKSTAETGEAFLAEMQATKRYLDSSRPTAVNLMWATARILSLVEFLVQHNFSVAAMKEKVLEEAQNLADEDVALNRRIGQIGSAVVPQNANIIHHCNTGALATVDYGTAIGVIYSCHEQGKNVHVWVDETRPRLQGAKLTAWELQRAGVPLHLIPDNAAGLLMYQGKVDIVLFGADRVTENGDVANKVGTFKLAVCAKAHNIPVFAVVPTSTIDLTLASGRQIPIEERTPLEVTHVGNECIAPVGVPVFNPGFDITPAQYLTGIITEEGICYPPFEQSLKAAKDAAEERIRQKWQERTQQLSAQQ